MKNITLSISPCPNDTFMFDGLIHGKIDCRGYSFEVEFRDIDCLNQGVKSGKSGDISKISYGVYPQIIDSYKILGAGSALGFGNAPLLVSRHKIYPDEIKDCKVAIPGFDTTAALLLKFGFGEIKELKSYLFSDIAEVVSSGEADAGVLIHEERFTYSSKDLKLVSDLGEIWDKEVGLPVALGAIVASNKLDKEVAKDIEALIADSIRFGFKNPLSSRNFIKQHAQKLDDKVIDSHIEMFVNEFSLDLGELGRKAVLKLLEQSGKKFDDSIFI